MLDQQVRPRRLRRRSATQQYAGDAGAARQCSPTPGRSAASSDVARVHGGRRRHRCMASSRAPGRQRHVQAGAGRRGPRRVGTRCRRCSPGPAATTCRGVADAARPTCRSSCPFLEEGSFARPACSGMIDIFVLWWLIVLCDRPRACSSAGRPGPIFVWLAGVYVVIAARDRRRDGCHGGSAVNRVSHKEGPDRGGVVVLLGGAVVGANFYSKREQGTRSPVEAVKKRDLEAIVSASGKIQAEALVNISADTMGRVTQLRGRGRRPRQGRPVPPADRPGNRSSATSSAARPPWRRRGRWSSRA